MSNARDKANIPVLNFSSKGIDDNADTNVITIDSSENVGINVTNPGSFYSGSNTLVVKDGISIFDTTDSRLEFVDGTSGSEAYVGNIVYNHASNFMRFGVDVSERMRLTTTGLGIGTTSPTSPLMVQSNETYPIHVKGANAKAILVETTGGETELAILQLKNSAYTWNVENGRSANTLTFYANSGGERMRIDSSGNVGIKNTVMSSFSNLPATDLVVGAGTTDSGITIYSGTTHGSNIAFADAPSGNGRNQGIIQYHHNGDYMRFFTSASEKMRIDSNGAVSIATTSASNGEKLKVQGKVYINAPESDSVFTTGACLIFPQTYNNIRQSTDHALNFDTWNNGSVLTPLTIKQDGKIGIGTTSPNAELEIKADTPEIRIDSTASSGRNYKIHSDGDELYLEGIGSSGSFKIGEDGTYGFNVDLGSGVVTVGKTNAGYDIAGVTLSNGGYGAFTQAGNPALILNRLTSEGSIVEFRQANGLRGTISVGGSATAYNTSSDYRLKENVNYDFDATSRLKELKPARFNFIEEADKTVDGFLAHEVSSIVPEAITGTKDAVDEDGNPEYQGIDQSKLVPLLVKTIQELEARITTLENK